MAFVNAIPVFISSDPEWAERFTGAGVPIIGDDIKSQVGATIVHRLLARLFEDRGLVLDRTYQLNVGGNMDFKNMLERERLESKKISKTQAVTSQLDNGIAADDVHIGPSDHVPWLEDRKWAYIRLEGRNFGDVPLNVELKLEVWDSPNSAGVIIDAVRCARHRPRPGHRRAAAGPVRLLHEVAAGAVPRRPRPPAARGVHRRLTMPADEGPGRAVRTHIHRRLWVVGAALGLMAAACGGSDEGDEGGGPSGARTEYAATLGEVRTLGREVVSQLAAGDLDPIRARFTPELAAQFSAEQMRQLAAQLRDSGGVGARTDEGELVPRPDFRIYVAEHQVGDGRWSFGMVFDAEGSIAGGDIRPALPALPPDPNAGYQAQATFRFPVEGEWFVFWGGDTDRTNYHVRAPDQRHAYDLVMWRDGGTHRGAGTTNDDYWAWGQEVRAPAAGTVVAAVDGTADNVPQTPGNPRVHPAGNHVLLEVGPGEHVLLAHFQQGSVRVKAGDRVEEGQLLGLCGNSGNSSEPHLHVHLQDSSTVLAGLGLPLAFSGLIVDGDQVAAAELEQGQFVEVDPGRR